MNYEYVKKDVVVELTDDTGEGLNGDYNPNDPYDLPLLRFYVYRKTGKTNAHSSLTPVDDASYCTCLPTSMTNDQIRECAKIIMHYVFSPLQKEQSIKKLCEKLSWICPQWIKKHKEGRLNI